MQSLSGPVLLLSPSLIHLPLLLSFSFFPPLSLPSYLLSHLPSSGIVLHQVSEGSECPAEHRAQPYVLADVRHDGEERGDVTHDEEEDDGHEDQEEVPEVEGTRGGREVIILKGVEGVCVGRHGLGVVCDNGKETSDGRFNVDGVGARV